MGQLDAPLRDTTTQARRMSEPLGFHVILRLEDDRPMAGAPAALRAVARVVLEQGERRGLLAFGTADDHLHAALATDRASAGEFARYVATALRWKLGIGARFERARIRPLHDQRHAYNTFHYIHRQDSRHGLDIDRTREGTSLPDLLGVRLLETSIVARVRAHLPRVRREDLVANLPPAPFEEEQADLDLLPDAAAAAFAIADVRARSPIAALARAAAVFAVPRETSSRLLSDCLGIGIRAVQTIRQQTGDPRAVRAVTAQLQLRAAAMRVRAP